MRKHRILYVTTLPAMNTAVVWPMPRGNPCVRAMMAMSDEICAGVDGGGHGTCIGERNNENQWVPTCVCNEGYILKDLTCIPHVTCGNGVIDEPEECDGEAFGNATCEDFGFYGGTLHCSDACRLDITACSRTCGDRVVQAEHEKCDDGKNGDDQDGCTHTCTFTCEVATQTLDCDDGLPCTDDICNPETHTCAHLFSAAETVCRPAVGDCNVPETCTGTSAECPADAFQPAETSCDDGTFCSINNQCNDMGQCISGSVSPNLIHITAIAVGSNHTCAITTTGDAKCWGNNQNGQLGNGTSENTRLTPVDVLDLTSGSSFIAAGSNHTCAIHNRETKCWWANDNGKLGNGTTQSSLTPVNVLCN